MNTGVKHSLAASAYNERRQECETGVAVLQTAYPNLKALRDADSSMLNQVRSLLSETVYQRCCYVIEEKERLMQACKAMQVGDLVSLGKCLFQTHAGLKDQYAVSCEELDVLVDAARQTPSVFGARLMGGGFGGCVLVVFQRAQAEFINSRLSAAFVKRFGRAPQMVQIQTADGASLIP